MGMQPQPLDLASEIKTEEQRKLEIKAKRIANLVPAKKGEVRNPRGRPKKDFILADLARVHAETAVKTLVSVMTNEDAPPASRVSAASEILDRGFGRAPQTLDVEHKIGISEAFEEFLREVQLARRGSKLIEHEAQILDAAE